LRHFDSISFCIALTYVLATGCASSDSILQDINSAFDTAERSQDTLERAERVYGDLQTTEKDHKAPDDLPVSNTDTRQLDILSVNIQGSRAADVDVLAVLPRGGRLVVDAKKISLDLTNHSGVRIGDGGDVIVNATTDGIQSAATFKSNSGAVERIVDLAPKPNATRGAVNGVRYPGNWLSIGWHEKGPGPQTAVGRIANGRFQQLLATGDKVPGEPNRLISSVAVHQSHESGLAVLAIESVALGGQMKRRNASIVLPGGKIIGPQEFAALVRPDNPIEILDSNQAILTAINAEINSNGLVYPNVPFQDGTGFRSTDSYHGCR
jgi:hypothetical protein